MKESPCTPTTREGAVSKNKSKVEPIVTVLRDRIIVAYETRLAELSPIPDELADLISAGVNKPSQISQE